MEKVFIFIGAHLLAVFIIVGIIAIFNRKLIDKRWEDVKWFTFELLKMYSGQPSFFAKKRVESGIAFFILQWGMIYYLVHMIHQEKMDWASMLAWATVEAAICGYMINQIMKDNKQAPNEKDTTPTINDTTT